MPLEHKYTRKMDKEEINALPLASYEGALHLVDNRRDAVIASNDLHRFKTLGFDTEKRPAFKKGQFFDPSLLQLAHPKAVYLFQLKKTGLPKELLNILANKDIVKAGVAVGRDIKELQDIEYFEATGFVDLGHKAREAGLKHHGLRGLAAVILGVRISKSAKLTNWARPQLPEKALTYAATDAWLGLRLYESMNKLRIC